MRKLWFPPPGAGFICPYYNSRHNRCQAAPRTLLRYLLPPQKSGRARALPLYVLIGTFAVRTALRFLPLQFGLYRFYQLQNRAEGNLLIPRPQFSLPLTVLFAGNGQGKGFIHSLTFRIGRVFRTVRGTFYILYPSVLFFSAPPLFRHPSKSALDRSAGLRIRLAIEPSEKERRTQNGSIADCGL